MVAFAKIAMECLHDPLICLLFLAGVAFAILQARPRRPLPPGPKRLPIIGNMMMAGQMTHRGLAALGKQYGGLLHLRMGGLRIFAVSTPEYAREVFQAQEGDFWHRPATIAILYLTYGSSDMAFAHDGRHWRQMRKLCATKLFSRRRAETWIAVHDGYGELARAVARSSVNSEAVNLGELIYKHTVNVILRAAFSAGDHQGLEEYIPVFKEYSKVLEAFHIGDFFPWLSWMGRRGFDRRLRAVRDALGKFADEIIDEHMRRGKNPDDADADMVDGLLAFLADANQQASGKDDDDLRFTRDNIKAMMMDMLFGGPDTVAFTIEWAMTELMHCPDILLRLQRELIDIMGLHRVVDESDLGKLPFLKCVVKETLRMHPPIPVQLRGAAKDCVLGGYSVPKGSRIFINIWAINRDADAWKDPDTFRPSRFMLDGEAIGIDLKGDCYELLPFGSGRRSCPAQGLGEHAVDFAVAQLMHGFNWKLPDDMNPMELDMSALHTAVCGAYAPSHLSFDFVCAGSLARFGSERSVNSWRPSIRLQVGPRPPRPSRNIHATLHCPRLSLPLPLPHSTPPPPPVIHAARNPSPSPSPCTPLRSRDPNPVAESHAPPSTSIHGVIALRRRPLRREALAPLPLRAAPRAGEPRLLLLCQRSGWTPSQEGRRRGGGGAGGHGHAPGHRREPGGRALRRVARQLLPRQLRRPPQVPRDPDRLHRQDEPHGEARGGDVAPGGGGHAGPEAGRDRRPLRHPVRPPRRRRRGQVHRGRLQEGQGQSLQWVGLNHWRSHVLSCCNSDSGEDRLGSCCTDAQA